MEAVIQEKATTTANISEGYKALEEALDKELNTAYRKLMQKLPEPGKQTLHTSQKQWVKFRDAEFSFLSGNFNQEEFGSSYVIPIGSYRTSIIEARVKELLWYLKNY